jgi:hypothetical protein
MGYVIIFFSVLLGILVGIGAVAVHYWQVSVPLLAGAVILWLRTRVNRLPANLPAQLRAETTTISDLVASLLSLLDSPPGEREPCGSLTSLQKKTIRRPKDPETLVNEAYRGTLVYLEGTVRDVAEFLGVITVTISVPSTPARFPWTVSVAFGTRWKRALAALHVGDHVEAIGAVRWLAVQKPPQGRNIYSIKSCGLNGKSLVRP